MMWMTFLTLLITTRPAMAETHVVKELHFPKDEEYGTIHVEAVMPVHAESAWRVLVDVDRWKEWMPYLSQAKIYSPAALKALPPNPPKNKPLFEKINQDYQPLKTLPGDIAQTKSIEATIYEAYDLSWPIKDEWVVRKYTFDPSARVGGLYHAQWGKIFDGKKEIEGYWNLKPVEGKPDQTVFVYHYRVRAKRGIALVFFKIAVKHAIDRMIDAIEKQARHYEKETLSPVSQADRLGEQFAPPFLLGALQAP